VSIPVDVIPATKSSHRIAFHQVHEPSGKRIRYEKVVPGIGPVDADDIVKGYEVEKGKYVLLSDEEIDEVKLEAKKSVDLVQFVDQDDIDPIYFERPFFVLPAGDSEDADEAYAVLRDALKKTRKIGLGQIVVRGQSSIVAIKPCGRGLVMETIRYADEVKKADTAFDDIEDGTPDKELLELGEELIKKKSGKFQREKFKDAYTTALRELIDAKVEKRAPKAIEEAAPASNVINLMDALKRSVRGDSGRSGAATKPKGKSRAVSAAARKKPAKKATKKAGKSKRKAA